MWCIWPDTRKSNYMCVLIQSNNHSKNVTKWLQASKYVFLYEPRNATCDRGDINDWVVAYWIASIRNMNGSYVYRRNALCRTWTNTIQIFNWRLRPRETDLTETKQVYPKKSHHRSWDHQLKLPSGSVSVAVLLKRPWNGHLGYRNDHVGPILRLINRSFGFIQTSKSNTNNVEKMNRPNVYACLDASWYNLIWHWRLINRCMLAVMAPF